MIYAYQCKTCNHELEVEQSIKDSPLTDCPMCRVASLKRVVTGGAGFVLTGDCWAKDGYAKK